MLLSLCVCRAVGGALDHGHAPGSVVPERGRVLWSVNHLLGLCHSHCRHPARHGGAVGLPARPASALVSHTPAHTHTYSTHTHTADMHATKLVLYVWMCKVSKTTPAYTHHADRALYPVDSHMPAHWIPHWLKTYTPWAVFYLSNQVSLPEL